MAKLVTTNVPKMNYMIRYHV